MFYIYSIFKVLRKIQTLFLLTLLLGQKFVCTKQLESTTYLHHHGNTVNTSNPIRTFGDKCFRLHHFEAIRKTSQKS